MKAILLVIVMGLAIGVKSQIQFEKPILDSLLIQEMIRIATFNNITNYGFLNIQSKDKDQIFIKDLVDTTNYKVSYNLMIDNECRKIRFENYHVYAFDYPYISLGTGNIMYIDSTSIVIFRAVECNDIGDGFENMYSYISEKMENNKDRGIILQRLRNYRFSSGQFFYKMLDAHSRFRCDRFIKILEKIRREKDIYNLKKRRME
jgi:hypothetical protein